VSQKRVSWLWFLLIGVAVVLSGTGVHAQSACAYAKIQLDTTQAIDVQAVCDAARSWDEKGYRVFVFLTDHRPGSEDEWFAFLDQAEMDVGLRDATGFAVNGLAFEASTATDLFWAYSVTYGEHLYDTKLDTDEQARLEMQDQMRAAIAAGDPTQAFVQALDESYEINYPPPSPLLRALPWVLGGVILVAILGVGAVAVGLFVVRPTVQRMRKERELQKHREALSSRTSNLLLTCDQLLHGDKPQETVLYQLFAAYGGEQYKAMRKDVREWLRRSQGALRDAFDLHQKLRLSSLERGGDLEQQVHDWEMLYVTLVGSSERILTLNDEELRTLLDPMLTMDRQAPDVQLAEQLDSIRDKLVGMPLKVEFKAIDPAKADVEGILGYIERVKAQTKRLQDAELEAPERLDKAKERRQTLGEQVPSPFVLTEKQLLGRIDERLEKATSDLQEGLFLRVTEGADRVLRDLDTVRSFLAVMEAHTGRRSEIDALLEKGYRPKSVEADLAEIELDIKGVAEEFAADNYPDAPLWLEELEADGQRALEGLRAWQQKQGQNADALARLCDWVERVEAYRVGEMLPAWEALQAYPAGNWAEAAVEMEEAAQSLDCLRTEALAQIERLNSTDGQDFIRAEHLLAQAAAELTQTEGQFQAVVNRLTEVQVAEANLKEALDQAEEAIAQAEMLRDQQDVKVGPEVDQQIEDAREHLEEARRLSEAREYLQAMEVQGEAMRLATAAQAAASEQVAGIDKLEAELQRLVRSVAGKVGQCKARAKKAVTTARRTETQEMVRRAVDALAAAKQQRAALVGLEDQALAEALRAAVAAYERAGAFADKGLEQIQADVDEYERRRRDAEQAVRDARAAIRRAQRKVDVAGSPGRYMLQKARAALPEMPTGEESWQALADMWKKAGEARSYAERAEAQASPATRTSTARRGSSTVTFSVDSRPGSPRSSRTASSRSYRPPRRSGTSGTATRRRSSGPSSASTRSSSRSTSSRSRSTSPSKRSSSTGTSRRSSSMGTSRRSSSTGPSKRSSSSGSSRRSGASGSSRRR
jgi:hypothetical protein